jgi:anti-anti-sigma factor
MSVNKNVSSNSNTVTIKIDGMFDLSIQQDFRKAYEEEGNTKNYIIDMRQTEYMDSAAFGMLLVFRDYLGGDKAKVVIKNASNDIKKSFEILQFDRMFSFE